MKNQTQQKERQAVVEAICMEFDGLRKTARWYTADPDLAEDLLQDTMVLALRFLHTYKSGTNLKAWLIRIMRNRHVSLARRWNLERRTLESEGKHAMMERLIGAMGRRNMGREGGVAHGIGLSESLVDAINCLNPQFRQAVWLCDVKGLSYHEAATHTQCPVGTIMSRLHRGRRALRRQLGSRPELEAA